MNINTDSLKSFLIVHEMKSFTKASEKLGLTQSALSQKIGRLEDGLEATLFIRNSEGLKLTDAGKKLFSFARSQLQMQDDFLSNFKSYDQTLSGHIRLAGFSSIMRSILIPKLAPFQIKNPGLSIEYKVYEVIDLLNVLKRGEADMVVTDYMPMESGIESIHIGEEEYVLIQAKKNSNTLDIYLDHGPHDNATESFFRFQGQSFKSRRGFMGDVYGILDGVAFGLGKAVMSKHLVENDSRFRIIPSRKKYVRPLALSYFKQSYYPTSHLQLRDSILNF